MPFSDALHVSRYSTRRMVRQLHHHVAEQRKTVMECRNRAEVLTAAGIAHAGGSRDDNPAPSLCFVEVASEKDIKQNFIPDGALSGIAVAVSDALDVQEFHTRSGLDTPMFHHVARKEFPLISWLRRQGAQFVGKLSCRTPLAISEGAVFGKAKPASVAVAEHACHYAISCSLNGPSSIACAVSHDIVGFKPSSQTFGTFTERFELTMPSMTLGLTARRVDDLMYLWQVYTASIDPVAYFEQTQKQNSAQAATPKDHVAVSHQPNAKEASTTADAARSEADGAAEESEKKGENGATATASMGDLSFSKWWNGQSATRPQHPDDTPKYARPEILDHSPYNYTVKDRHGHMADIDVGWRDYNAEAAMADDFNRSARPGFLRRMFTGNQVLETPRVELAVGYPAEWIGQYCKGKYASSDLFHKQLADAVYLHSALHKNQKLEIIPLAFDFSIEEVLEATTVITHYELAKAFERLFMPSSTPAASSVKSAAAEISDSSKEPHLAANTNNKNGGMEAGSGGVVVEPLTLDARRPAAPNRANTFTALSGVLEELPNGIVESILAGQKLTVRDYNRALRIRDDVVRGTEEQFMDVDMFVVPLLCDPYTSGDLHSVRLTLPFHLAGHPILSVQVDPETPVALIGELGRDAALMEDAFCFLQFVRGASPKWWRQRVFGESVPPSGGASSDEAVISSSPNSAAPPAVSTASKSQ